MQATVLRFLKVVSENDENGIFDVVNIWPGQVVNESARGIFQIKVATYSMVKGQFNKLTISSIDALKPHQFNRRQCKHCRPMPHDILSPS